MPLSLEKDGFLSVLSFFFSFFQDSVSQNIEVFMRYAVRVCLDSFKKALHFCGGMN